jgi:hypothetical protein
VFFFALGGWRFLFLFSEVEGFVLSFECSKFLLFILNLKVLAHTFECWRFWLLFFDVKGYCFYFWMLKVFTFGFSQCWKFLFLFLDIEASYFYFLMLRVLILTLKCWRFLFLDVHQNYVYKVRFFQKHLKL